MFGGVAWEQREHDRTTGQDKSAAFGPAHMVGRASVFERRRTHLAGALGQKRRPLNDKSAIAHLDAAWRRS
jgi:hypothetical protein